MLTFSLLQFENLKNLTEEERKAKKVKCPHKCLKVVELIGFVGCGVDLEIASYLLRHSVSLEKMIIDTCHSDRCKIEDPSKLLEARIRARQHLETRLPTGTQLVV
jgi:rRNA processing protein Krr1/Pno1